MKGRFGLTLLEILVSLIILASAIGGITSVLISSRSWTVRSQHRLQATNIARQVLESLYQYVREDIWNDPDSPLYAPEPVDSQQTRDCTFAVPTLNLPTGYTCNYTVISNGANRYRTVRVNVGYPTE